MGLVGDLLERAARATPAAVDDRRTGWWFRHTRNATWWSGAVLAHGPTDRLGSRVEAAERFYAEHRSVTRFQVCPDCPAGLDHLLAERGYRSEAPVSLLTAAAAGPSGRRPAAGLTASLKPSLDPGWLAVLAATSLPGTDVEDETALLAHIDHQHLFVTVFCDDEPVGIGRAVLDAGWTGIFNMATKGQARRRGVAHLVLSAIAGWAEQEGTPQLYLQVERSNARALRLYDTAGFTGLATYHYRVREEPVGC